jgi:hypothetical protein
MAAILIGAENGAGYAERTPAQIMRRGYWCGFDEIVVLCRYNSWNAFVFDYSTMQLVPMYCVMQRHAQKHIGLLYNLRHYDAVILSDTEAKQCIQDALSRGARWIEAAPPNWPAGVQPIEDPRHASSSSSAASFCTIAPSTSSQSQRHITDVIAVEDEDDLDVLSSAEKMLQEVHDLSDDEAV